MPYAIHQGVRIYWEEEGSGDPLLLLMGLSFSMAMWGDLRPFFAGRFRVILLDNRGAGKSDTPAGPFSMGSLASDAACVLDEAGVPAADVFGISMGGMIAQEFALRFPQRVRRLVLGCTHPGTLRSKWGPPGALRALTSPFLSRPARLAAILPYLYDPNTPRDRIDRDIELIRENAPSTTGFLRQLAAIFSWSAYARLPRIKAPTLVLHGETDRLVPPENGRMIASRIPGSKLVILPNAGHIFPTDQPDRTRAEVMDFLGPVRQE